MERSLQHLVERGGGYKTLIFAVKTIRALRWTMATHRPGKSRPNIQNSNAIPTTKTLILLHFCSALEICSINSQDKENPSLFLKILCIVPFISTSNNHRNRSKTALIKATKAPRLSHATHVLPSLNPLMTSPRPRRSAREVVDRDSDFSVALSVLAS